LSTKWKGTVFTVSHDCDFLDNIVTDIIHVDEQKLNYYSGNVTSFEKMKNQILAKKVKNWKLQQKTVKEFTAQGLTVEKASKRSMEKLGIAELMDSEPREYRVNFNFKFAEDDAPTISVLDAGFYYPAEGTKAQKRLFSGLRFSIGTKSRVCLVGANGSGKTSLLKLLTGRAEPTEGVVSFHRLLRLGIYDQHFDEILPFNLSPIAYLTTQFESVTELEARKYLGMFGLDGARHLIKVSGVVGGGGGWCCGLWLWLWLVAVVWGCALGLLFSLLSRVIVCLILADTCILSLYHCNYFTFSDILYFAYSTLTDRGVEWWPEGPSGLRRPGPQAPPRADPRRVH
jgi:ATP-binding cassette subfamily F protein 1